MLKANERVIWNQEIFLRRLTLHRGLIEDAVGTAGGRWRHSGCLNGRGQAAGGWNSLKI